MLLLARSLLPSTVPILVAENPAQQVLATRKKFWSGHQDFDARCGTGDNVEVEENHVVTGCVPGAVVGYAAVFITTSGESANDNKYYWRECPY